MLYLLILLLAVNSASSTCCSQTWTRNPDEQSLNVFINKTMPGEYEMLIWQWVNKFNDGLWTVNIKRWPNIGYMTGSMKFKNLVRNTETHLGWKVRRNYLTWTRKVELIFHPAWNMSVCNLNLDWGFQPGHYGRWSFQFGNVSMDGEVGSSHFPDLIESQCKNRSKRSPQEEIPDDVPEVEGEDGSKSRSFIKWLLRKTGLEQGDNDQRGWMERIADAVIAWFRRLFSTS